MRRSRTNFHEILSPVRHNKVLVRCIVCDEWEPADEMEWFGDSPVCVRDAEAYRSRLYTIEAWLRGEDD